MNLFYLTFIQLCMFSAIHSPDSNYRQVLIFGKSQHPELVEQQLKLLNKDSNALKERDIQIIVVEKESKLWRQYKIPSTDFTVLLIGKDGFEKHRTLQLLQTNELFGMIDAMPMRQSEMRRKN